MNRTASASDAPPPKNASSFGRLVLVSEAVLALLTWGLGRWSGVDWGAMLTPTAHGMGWGLLGGIGLVTLHLLVVVRGGTRNPLYRRIYVPLHRMVHPWAQSASPGAVVGVALVSGVVEECFFRGWLQLETNVVVASLAFGAAHLWGREALAYGAYVTAMGLGLGGLFAYTGQHLWAPGLAHVLNNLLGLLALRYDWIRDPDRTD